MFEAYAATHVKFNHEKLVGMNKEKTVAETTKEKRENHRITSMYWRASNKEHSRRYQAAYYLAHKKKMKAQALKWAKDNPEAMRISAKSYYRRKMDRLKAEREVK